jgi:hypothetical protein
MSEEIITKNIPVLLALQDLESAAKHLFEQGEPKTREEDLYTLSSVQLAVRAKLEVIAWMRERGLEEVVRCGYRLTLVYENHGEAANGFTQSTTSLQIEEVE